MGAQFDVRGSIIKKTQNYGTSLHSHYKEHKKLMRCSGSASFFSQKKLANKKWAAENISKENFKTYRRDDYVKSVKNIHKQKHTHKKNKRLLADDLKKERLEKSTTKRRIL